MAKFGGMPMPKKGKKEAEESMADDMDLFGDDAMETDGEIEDEGGELDLSEDKAELAKASDEDLIAELKKRGIKVGGEKEPDGDEAEEI